MNKEQVVELMKSSKSEAEWNANCDKVKRTCAVDGRSQFPPFWYGAIVLSGVMGAVQSSWGGR